jgi:hypothetical protein
MVVKKKNNRIAVGFWRKSHQLTICRYFLPAHFDQQNFISDFVWLFYIKMKIVHMIKLHVAWYEKSLLKKNKLKQMRGYKNLMINFKL